MFKINSSFAAQRDPKFNIRFATVVIMNMKKYNQNTF